MKRLIEVDFPIKEVSEESMREKNIRYGVFFLDERKAAEITASLRREVPHIAFLMGDSDKEKAKRLWVRREKLLLSSW